MSLSDRLSWFPFYANAYDHDTADLTVYDDGLYFRMLRRAWLTSDDLCSLPADPKKLCRVLGVARIPASSTVSVVHRFWILEGDRLVNGRLRVEAAKAFALHEVARCNGKLGGRPPKSYSLAPAKLEPKLIETHIHTHTQEPKSKSNIRAADAAELVSFSAWWQVYPRRAAKQAAWKAWLKIDNRPSLLPQIMNATRAYAELCSKRDPDMIAHGATWLNGRRWEDENVQREPDMWDKLSAEQEARR